MDRIQEIGHVAPGPLSRAVQQEIETQLAQAIPPGKRGALLVVAGKDGAQFQVAAALDRDGQWKLAGNASTTWGGDVTGSVVLAGSW